MNAIAQALAYGYTATQILDQLFLKDKKLAKKAKKAMAMGYTPEQILQGMGNVPSRPSAASQSHLTVNERVEQNLASGTSPGQRALSNIGKGVGTALALGTTAYGLARAASPVASTIAGYLSDKFNTPTSQPSGETIQPSAILPPVGSPAAPSSAAPIGSGGGGFLKSLIPAIASLFGFKNKKLIDNIATIVQNTGQDVQQVYNELSENYDISTPEKAAAAADTHFKRIQGEETAPTTVEKVLEKAQQHKDILKRFRPVSEKKGTVEPANSAVIRRTEYFPDTRKLAVVFNSGSVYEYDDVPEEVYKNLLQSATPAKTEGKNAYGAWWVGKNPSLGATFNNLIKKGGFDYRKVAQGAAFNPEIISEEEESLLTKDALSTLIGKTTAAAGGEKFAGKQKKPLTREQMRNRRLLLEKSLQDIKNKPQAERQADMIDSINERLRTLKELDKLVGSKKSKLINEEILRTEKAEGKKLIKKMLVLLPASIVKVLKQKIENIDEEEALKLIKSYLTKK